MRRQPLAAGPGAYAVLVRHFLSQFSSFESLSTSGEVKPIVIAVLTLLAAPGYYTALMAVIGNTRRLIHVGDRMPPLLWQWREEWLLLAASLSAVAVFVAVQWGSFLLSGRDYRILGVMPVPRRTVIAAKLASLVITVGLLHLAVNALAGLVLPLASPFGYPRAALALQLTLLAQSVFACCAIVALQGVVSFALPAALAQRAASAVQCGVLLGVAFLLVTEGALSRLAFAMHDTPHPVNLFLPLAWFAGLYERLLGADAPQVVARARLAAGATALAVATALPFCLLGYRDAERREGSAAQRFAARWERIDAWLQCAGLRRPIARAVASFVTSSLQRSPLAALIARAWFVLGVALSLSGLVGLLWSARGHSASVIPSAPLYAPAILLPFFGLVGLRLSAGFPAWLEANWLFRITETPAAADYAAGVRAAALRAVVLPMLAALAIPYAVALGPWLALRHLGFALAVALVTVEWLFLGFGKIPFTCSYGPGKANLRVTWPKYAAIGLVYCGLLPALENRLLGSAAAYAVAMLLLASGWLALARLRARGLARGGRLAFDDPAPCHLTRLGIDD